MIFVINPETGGTLIARELDRPAIERKADDIRTPTWERGLFNRRVGEAVRPAKGKRNGAPNSLSRRLP